VAARATRTLGYGCTSVLLAGMLADDGRTPLELGLLLGVASAGTVVASLVLGFFADRWGRRLSLLVSALLMAVAGVLFSGCESYPVLVAAAFIGTVSPSTNDNTPFSGVEQAILAQTCPPARHTSVFTVYNVVALLAGALGGLLAAALGLWSAGVSAGDAAFALYALLALITGALSAALSPRAEAATPRACKVAGNPAEGRRARLPRRVRLLTGLFALDAFAGGLAAQTMLAWWLHQRFQASIPQLGLLFFAANLLPALSQLAAPALASRRGLLATMLVPHLISNLLLLCLPAAPTFGVAAALLLVRQSLSKIDVPARQAFVAAIVDASDRTAAASMTSVARSVAVSVSPVASSVLLTGPLAAVGAPLLLAGSLALGYDAAMWRAFRDLPAGATAALPARDAAVPTPTAVAEVGADV
jgi:MFS family permease